MKIKLLFIFITLIACENIFAQAQLVKQWDYRFGGDNFDNLRCVIELQNSSIIAGGNTASDSSGDVTEPNRGMWDFWIVKTNVDGIKLWDKRFGGISTEFMYAISETNDGGCILGGLTASDSSWDVTEHTRGMYDCWIVKLDSSGTKLWDKRFGGLQNERVYSLLQTDDEGYLIGGTVISDSGGDVSEYTRGMEDYWIIKTDSLGNKLWDKRFGGNSSDFFRTVVKTMDGSYILSGYTFSEVNGDVTDPKIGEFDIWIVKCDSMGNKLWDKRYGGYDNEIEPYGIYTFTDGSFVIGGMTFSDSGAFVSEQTRGEFDYWIIKIDSAGNKLFDKRFGGSVSEDSFGYVVQTFDHGLLLSGTSKSPANGDKSENNLGAEQAWIIKTDSLGNKLWDKTIFTKGPDHSAYALQTLDSCYLIAVAVLADTGGYVTHHTRGAVDYWFIKFCDSTATTAIINYTNFNSQISVNPNPFSSEISISIKKDNIKRASFSILNMLGQTIFNKTENNISSTYTKIIDLNILASGIYLLDVIVDGERTVKKIVKE